MSGGGGGGKAPQAQPVFTDPVNGKTFTDADALNQEINARKADEDRDSQTASAAAAAQQQQTKDEAARKDAQDESDFQSRFSTAKTTARDGISRYFSQQGYDPSQYGGDIDALISRESQGVAPRSANPSASFDPNAGASLVSQLIGGARTQASRKITNAFAPTYAADNINSSWLPDAETPLLNNQFDPLSDQLKNAQKRGTLNDTGYQAALDALGAKRTSGKATLDTLGNNILNTNKGGVNDYITGAKNDAANVDLTNANSFSADPYIKGAGDLVKGYRDSFAGDLSNALGSTSFADIGSLLNAGGSVQGALDPTVTSGAAGASGDVSDAYLAQQALAQQKRGIGTQSSF